MAFTLPLSYQARPRQPLVLDSELIAKREVEVMTFKLFEKLIFLDTLGGKGGKGTCLIFSIPTNGACNHTRSLYVMAKFNRQ